MDNISALKAISGVVEWYRNETEALLIVKYDGEIIDEGRIKEALA
jgi:hypothetical protein